MSCELVGVLPADCVLCCVECVVASLLVPYQQVVGGAAFLLMMIRPFLRHISKESRRCAELLVQLPPDFDVEGMVAATWSVVKKVDARRGGGDRKPADRLPCDMQLCMIGLHPSHPTWGMH